MSSLISLVRTEMAKQVRRMRTYLVLAIVVVIPILITVALKYGHQREQRPEGDQLFRIARQSGIVVPAAALAVMSAFFLVIVVAVFAGDAVASEASWGNLRYQLVRPISRARLLGAKLFVAFVFAFIATGLIALTGLAAGVLAFGWHPVDLPLLGIHQTTGQLLAHLGVVTAYIAWSMASVVALGFMVSTMTSAPAGAIASAVVFAVVSEIFDAIPALGSIRYGLPMHYLNAWTELVTRAQANSDMLRGVLLQVPYVVVFCGIAFWYFRRKDILS